MASYRIGVLSDTHGYLNPRLFELFAGVDMIIHAGDVQGDHILDELETIAPIHAVSGNVDPWPEGARRPLEQRLTTPAGRIAVTHGHMAEAPSVELERMANYFEDFHPEIIIYGHSHVPLLEQVAGVTFFNPGSAGPSRFGERPSAGMIETREGKPPVLRHFYFEHRPRS